jgi:hypothetical protein
MRKKTRTRKPMMTKRKNQRTKLNLRRKRRMQLKRARLKKERRSPSPRPKLKLLRSPRRNTRLLKYLTLTLLPSRRSYTALTCLMKAKSRKLKLALEP